MKIEQMIMLVLEDGPAKIEDIELILSTVGVRHGIHVALHGLIQQNKVAVSCGIYSEVSK